MSNKDKEPMDKVENQLIDMRLAVSALLETTAVYQRNFEIMIAEIREIQMDVRGLQTENRQILDILQNRLAEGES